MTHIYTKGMQHVLAAQVPASPFAPSVHVWVPTNADSASQLIAGAKVVHDCTVPGFVGTGTTVPLSSFVTSVYACERCVNPIVFMRHVFLVTSVCACERYHNRILFMRHVSCLRCAYTHMRCCHVRRVRWYTARPAYTCHATYSGSSVASLAMSRRPGMLCGCMSTWYWSRCIQTRTLHSICPPRRCLHTR